jgi:hypothetical protein
MRPSLSWSLHRVAVLSVADSYRVAHVRERDLGENASGQIGYSFLGVLVRWILRQIKAPLLREAKYLNHDCSSL